MDNNNGHSKIEVGEAHMDKQKETFSSIEMKLKS